jgi:hypothetical protein
MAALLSCNVICVTFRCCFVQDDTDECLPDEHHMCREGVFEQTGDMMNAINVLRDGIPDCFLESDFSPHSVLVQGTQKASDYVRIVFKADLEWSRME